MRERSLPVRLRRLAVCVLVAGVVLAAVGGRADATTITASPVDFSAAEQSAFSGAVATFTDDNSAATPADFTATIDWGDGSSATAGTIASSSAAFAVLGMHTYADEGSFTVTVTISDVPPGTGTATATDTATITEADSLSGTPVSFVALAGTPFTGTVATFTDTLTSSPAGDFTATINWGDATTTAGTVAGGGGSFSVSGTHTYAGSGTFSVTVTLSDDAPGTATAQVTSTATVGGAGITIIPVTFAATEGVTFSGVVANFSDSRGGAVPSDFTATIEWGDGATTAGTVASTGGGTFSISGMHIYTDEGAFAVIVGVKDNVSGATGATKSTANVAEGDALSGTPVTFSPIVNVPFTGVVATFTDSDVANVPADFTATIDWGDATTTAGTVAGGGGSFSVSGTHTYTSLGSFTVVVTLADDAPGTATAATRSTANVAATVVPALDWRGLLALMLALAAAGLFVLRRV
jgi:hypothetical protein